MVKIKDFTLASKKLWRPEPPPPAVMSMTRSPGTGGLRS